MITTLTTKPLLTVFTYDGKKYHKETTIEQYREEKPQGTSLRDLVLSCGTRTRFSNVKSVRNANGVEYFEYFIVPKLPKDEQMWWWDRSSRFSDKKPKLEIILAKLEEYRESKQYYATPQRTQEEKQRFREIADQHRKKFSFLQS